LLDRKIKSFSYKIKPGELAKFDKTNRRLLISNVNTSKYTSWKEGIINIYNQSLEELTERLEVRYNQKFKLDNEVKNFHFTFTIKNESIDEIIKLMEKISPITAIQKKDTIIFKLDKNRERMVDNKF
jgi:ferric-dicitrate binding protein FerR (iron transport regulator)